MLAAKDELFTRPSGGYNIARSVRLRSSATAYFNRTLTTPTNNKIWTWSSWVKRGILSSAQVLLSSDVGTSNTTWLEFGFDAADTFTITAYTADSNTTSAVFRDPSAWYHIIVAFDSTQATAANRCKIYVNGVQQTLTGSGFTLNAGYGINSAQATAIGFRNWTPSGRYFDGYLTEINFVDGQQLTPSSFGSTNAITGVWQPKAYSGTYGTNGFELNFSDNSNNTAATIGKDYSGNGNNWTPNNISVTAGATYDSMQDVPTLTSATAANYAVLNPLLVGDYFASGQTTFAITNGNLNYGATGRNAFGSIAVSSGKWYWEMVNTSNTTAATALFGVVTVASRTAVYGCYYNAVNGNKGLGTLNSGATETAYGATWTDNDVIGVAVDMDAATPTVTFYKNNTSQGAISVSSFVGQSVMMWFQNGGNTNNMSGNVNFGQRPFTYTPPTGFVALNTYNLPASTITNGAAYMAATTYTGNGSTQTITNTVGSTSFQPDFVWIKLRNQAGDYHNLFDSVRGIYKRIFSNDTQAENTNTDTLTAFNSNGFSVGTNGNVNTNAINIIGWQWKAGTTSVTNTNGSITSTVNAGATQGFSVVTYTGTGSSATVGHGLGVAPSMIICKARGQAENWAVYHSSLSNAVNVALFLNLTNAVSSASNAYWNSTAPSSTVFSVNTATTTNAANTMVAYCFSAVAGYSAFGSFTGNGSADGPFVYTGFRPAFVMAKLSSATGDWNIVDDMRQTYNDASGNPVLRANTSGTEEDVDTMQGQMDILSNGFKLRSNNSSLNASGGTIIYAAFAKNPFKYALAR